MKKTQSSEPPSDEMRAHYDFDYSRSRPNRFASGVRRKPDGPHELVKVTSDSDATPADFDESTR
jgi:hypothetical protein